MRRPPIAAAIIGLALSASCEPVDAVDPNKPDQFSVMPTPGKPTIDSLVSGDRQIALYYHAGDAMSFSAVCRSPNPNGFGGGKSPIIVTGLVNNIEYSCNVWAFNASKVSPPSDTLKATPRPPS